MRKTPLVLLYLLSACEGMLLGAEVYVRVRSLKQVYCAKFHHQNGKRCIFRCNYPTLLAGDG
jgi:aquaporin Z